GGEYEWQGASTTEALLHTLEGIIERVVCDAYHLGDSDIQAIVDEMGTPVGWYSLIAGYDAVPTPPAGIRLQFDMSTHPANHERLVLDASELGRLKARL